MDIVKVKNGGKYFGLLGSLFIILLVIISIVTLFLFQLEKNKFESQELLKQDVLHRAVAHFDNILLARIWSASHGGVYIKEHDGILPNPYLRDNVMYSDKNETFIKVNPAWMTRQISEISNKNSKHYYKITSLKPINPINKADDFEREALEYFEKNKEEPYYSRFKKTDTRDDEFYFMGSLKVVQSCLVCHLEQGYKVGDIRGGIRVTLPLEDYNNRLNFIEKESNRVKWIVIIFGFIIGLLATIYMRKIFTNQKEILELNGLLERKVNLRTRELLDVNKTLQERVADEVQKSRAKDEAMLTQSRYLAMGEMIEMIAHQWRQPIAVIEMSSGNLLVNFELGVDDKEEMQENLQIISAQTQELSKIISDFINIFNSNSAPVLVEARICVEEVLGVMQSTFEHYGITVETNYESRSELMLMSRELFQVYWNLINNAKEILVERKVHKPKICISIKEDEKDVIVSISDNAGGIEDQYINKIFEPYFSTKNNLNGRGLGLYICKSIVEKHLHGTISAENDEEGAVFTVYIPKKTDTTEKEI